MSQARQKSWKQSIVVGVVVVVMLVMGASTIDAVVVVG